MDETRVDPLRSAPREEGPLETLAAEYVRNRLAGETVDVTRYLDRLVDDGQRTRFLELVDGAETADGLLPRQIREGTVLAGRYRIRRPLGAGGMGKVFVAWDETLKREVAVKVLALFDSDSVDAGSLFRRESELLASLQHPGIVAIHETGSEGDVPYLVMDLVVGRALGDVIERLADAAGDGEPPRDGAAWRGAIGHDMPDGGRDLIGDDGYCRVAARIAAELARTIEAAHGKGVVHRDLKPGNVLLRGDGTPIVLDFGLAGRFGGAAGELTRGLFGSAAYVAPEQARAQQTGSDPSTDLYQLGLILYEMLTLRRAFPGDDVSTVLGDICSGRFERPRRWNRAIPVPLESIVLKAMELDPSRRYASATALREDLERFLRGEEAPRAMGGGRLAMAWRDGRYFARRHRNGLLVATALAVGATATWGLLPSERVELVRVDRGMDQVRPFTLDDATGARRFGAAVVRPGQVIGVELVLPAERYVYVYGLSGPKDDPYRHVVALEPADDRGRNPWSIHDPTAAFVSVLPAGTTEILCSEAEEENDFESIVVFALEERHPGLEHWLRALGRRKVPLAESLAILERADVDAVFPPGRVTRGRPVWAAYDERERAAMVESLRAQTRRVEFEYPFDELADQRFVRFPVEKE
ncbi:MAG: serine/threonine-protein kinase [Planctomycetota bacterium JB042]